MKNKIPDRWLEYSPMGTKVAGTRFIAFKAPLSKEICNKMKPGERFTPDILMERCPNMRLIIDLTNTDRYYNKQEFIDRGIQYEKIMCPGQVIPPPSLIFRFFEIIDDFYLKNGLKDVLIGIHCTHGVNRTGYFIGRYMVQRMGFHYEKAIPCIEEARGHKIERTNYIKDLMIQEPIPSSLTSSSGKKVIEPKSEQKKASNNTSNKGGGKVMSERTPEKHYSRKPVVETREPPARSRRTPEPNPRVKEPSRPGNYGSGSGRPPSPVSRRGPSPVRRPHTPPRRGPSPVRRGFSPGRRPATPGRRPPSPGRRPPSPGRRPASPGRRMGRGPSPKRVRTPPRSFSPRRRSPKRSPSRRFSPPRREGDFGPPYRGNDDRNFPRNGPPRNYSPPRRMDPPPPSNFPTRGPPENQNYGPSGNSSWHQQYESRNFNSAGPNTNYRPPGSNQFLDSRPMEKHHSWENRSNNPPSFNDSKPSYGGSGPSQWNAPPPHDFSRPPPNVNLPPPNMESRSGGFNHPLPGRFNERRFDEAKFPPPREEGRRPWNDNRTPQTGPPFTPGRFEENRGFSDRGNDYRHRPDDKYEKPYSRSPPRELHPPRGDFSREKRPPSPFREPRREFDSVHPRPDEGWDNRRRSPVPPFSERDPYGRSGPIRRRSKSPIRRASPPRRSRSPRRRSPPRSFEQRRSPPRNRPGDHPPAFNQPHLTSSGHHEGPPRSGPESSYQEKRFYDSRDDCRDLLNQKRNFEGERGSFYEDPKPPKLGVRDIPKEVDLRKIIGSGGPNETQPMKYRLGPPPRDEQPAEGDARGRGRGRSRSPRGRSPSRYGPPRRY